MIHAIYRVQDFQIVKPYTLRVTFNDGVSQVIDFHRVLAGERFGPLRDVQLFNQVTVDPEVHTLVWPNGADFDPATCDDWPDHVAALSESNTYWSCQVS